MQVFRSLANGGWTDVDGDVTGEELHEAFQKLFELKPKVLQGYSYRDRSGVIRDVDGEITRRLYFHGCYHDGQVYVSEGDQIKPEVHMNSVYSGKFVWIGSLDEEKPPVSTIEEMRNEFVKILRECRKQKPNWPDVGAER